MRPLMRFLRFAGVGLAGSVLQFGLIAMLPRLLGQRPVLVSVIALELTLLQNFAGHWYVTWRDRRAFMRPSAALWRFHVTNGLVSLLGTMLAADLLTARAHMALLQANGVAVLCCGVANFYLAGRWPFRAEESSAAARKRAMVAAVLVVVAVATQAGAQSAGWAPIPNEQTAAGTAPSPANDLPDAPAPVESNQDRAPAPTSRENWSYVTNAGIFCGVGASTSPDGTLPTIGCGAGFTFFPIPIFLEVGVMGPQANRSHVSGYVSVDGSIPLAPISGRYVPFAVVGYSRLFETGHALDYGIALALPRPGKLKDDPTRSLRLELRDYYTFADPAQHNVMLRVGWMTVATD